MAAVIIQCHNICYYKLILSYITIPKISVTTYLHIKGESHACIMCFSFSTCSCCCCSTMTFFLSFFRAKLLFESDLSVTSSTRPNPPTPNVPLVSRSIKVKLAYSLVHFFGVNERFCFSYSANQSLLRISSRLPR